MPITYSSSWNPSLWRSFWNLLRRGWRRVRYYKQFRKAVALGER